jgi:hypothetical protein
MVDLRDPYERAKMIEESRRESAEMRADLERRRNAPDYEPIRSPPMQKKDYGEGLVYKRHDDATGEPAVETAMTPEASAAWNAWWTQCLENEWKHGTLAESIAGAIVRIVDQRTEPLEKKIRALERRLVRKGRR